VFPLDWIGEGLSAHSKRYLMSVKQLATQEALECRRLRLVLDLDETLVHTRRVKPDELTPSRTRLHD
jgi:NLI interacting factor-like phosphatase